MKKIWNVKMLIVIVLICVLFYSIFMGYYINYFSHGHSMSEEVGYSVEMTQRYGPTLEAEEHSEFVTETREDLIDKADTYIKVTPILSEAGIHTYEDFERIRLKRDMTEMEKNAIWTLFGRGEDSSFVGFNLQAINIIEGRLDEYQFILDRLASETTSEKKLARIMEIRETEEYRNIMDRWVFDNTVTYTKELAILAVLAVLIFVSALIVTDRSRNVHLLQYTAKQGRRILKQQLIAVILSAFLLTTALILVFGAIYSSNGTWLFWNNGLTSFLNRQSVAFWFDITYGQYIMVYIVLLYMLCLGAAAAAFVLSRLSKNSITLILKLIPAFALLVALSRSVFVTLFSFDNILVEVTGIIGIESIVCGAVLILGLALSLYMVRREKKVEVI
ncbi:hypothetical protein ACK8P5_04630 [Paenibacillus sp. EC2-1]|uniref:hypothetical protein n=1 Tax=Paenibacillus sp. EC2-1 TaxID=3388665 RepID=UPI003BEEDD4C